MKGLVLERSRLRTIENLMTRGNMVMVLRMVSLSEGAARKNYDQKGLSGWLHRQISHSISTRCCNDEDKMSGIRASFWNR
jgi:hypothetical protein